MNLRALFDRLAVDLEASGATVGDEGSLEYEGRPFARFEGEGMSFRLGADSPARQDALGRESASPARPGWVHSPASDVAQWPKLAEQALTALRRS